MNLNHNALGVEQALLRWCTPYKLPSSSLIVTEPTGIKGVTLLSKLARMREKVSVFSKILLSMIGMLTQNC